MTVTVRYTEAILRRAILAFLGRSFLRHLMVPATIAVSLLAFSFTLGTPWVAAFFTATVLLIPAMIVLAYGMHLRRSLKRFSLLEDGEVRLTVNEEGTIAEAAHGRSEAKWKVYTRLWEFPDVFLLFYGEGQFITLPRDQVPPEFIEFIRQHLPRI